MSRDLKTLCPFCGVGCGLLASSDGSRISKIKGDPRHPANFGSLCPKGATVDQTVNTPNRLTQCFIRSEPVSPSRAIGHIAEKLSQIIRDHGPESVAFYLSGQMTTESQYVAGKFAKAFLRTNHCDSNSRLCMSSAATGMNLSLGSDGPPVSYADIDLADSFLFIGSNAAETHPITFSRIRRRIDKHAGKCIVVDPRRTSTAEAAMLHLPIRPGTDLALLNGLLHLLQKHNKLDPAFIAQHTEGWHDLQAILPLYPPERVAQVCGIDAALLHSAAEILIRSQRFMTLWTMGVNQSVNGTFASNAIINLHLATGQIGKPGCGPFSLTGQPNAMGGRDVGYMSHQLPGQRFIANPEHRAEMEKFWGLPADHLAPHPGYDTVRIFDAAACGEIKAIWIIATNPAASLPNLAAVRAGLERAELVIVQDAYAPTETSKYAHVLLPAAVNLEQAGTFCNSERRVSLMEQVVRPPGDARPDWWWVQEVAHAMGFFKGMSFRGAADIFDEFARSTAGRPNDQSAMHHTMLREKGPQQWPYPAMGKPSERRYTDHRFPTPTGKARFLAREFVELEERTSREFPLILTTGRVLNQWHTRTKTGQVAVLNKLDPAPFLQMHPDDALALGLHDRQHVAVTSRFGSATTFVRLDAEISPGVVFMPIHWNDLWAHRSSCNEATSNLRDAISKQPALKAVAVSVTPVTFLASQPTATTASEPLECTTNR